MGQNLTQGNLVKLLISFTLPLMLSGIFQQLFNWVDAFIVGNVNGESALAAIGATTTTYSLFVMIITGFTSGLSVLAAQKFGMDKQEEITRILSSFALLLGGLFLLLSVLGVLFVDYILVMLDTPADIYAEAGSYLQIIFAGIPFLAVYNVYAAVLRGIGDSRTSFWAVLVASGVNVSLDLLLVACLHYGVAGAAVATAVSQLAMAVFMTVYTIWKYPFLRFRLNKQAVQKSALLSGCRYGLPPAVQSGITSGGNLILQRFMNGFGEQTVAAITTAYRVDTVILLPIINFGSGIATVAAQNIGAGESERAKEVLKTGSSIIALAALCLSALVFCAGEPLISIFGLTPEAAEIGGSFFRRLASCYVFYALAMAFRGYLEGTGDMVFSGAAGILALGVRIAASYACDTIFGNMIIAYAEAFSWVVLLGVYMARYYHKRQAL